MLVQIEQCYSKNCQINLSKLPNVFVVWVQLARYYTHKEVQMYLVIFLKRSILPTFWTWKINTEHWTLLKGEGGWVYWCSINKGSFDFNSVRPSARFPKDCTQTASTRSTTLSTLLSSLGNSRPSVASFQVYFEIRHRPTCLMWLWCVMMTKKCDSPKWQRETAQNSFCDI